MKMYFTSETENAIIEYNNTNDQARKNYLYNTFIDEPFLKLTEVIINDYRFYFPGITVQETQSKTISHLLEKLPHYDQSCGKAFSYFTVVARNFLLNMSKEHYAYLKQHDQLNEIDFIYEETDTEEIEEKIRFFEKTLQYFEDNLNFFFVENRAEYKIAITLLEILKNRDTLTILNKKAIYLTIREILPDIESIQITHVVAKFKAIYKTINSNYIETGRIQFHPYKLDREKEEDVCQNLIK